MTPEEAINYFHGFSPANPFRQTAESALNKQIPMKVDTTARRWTCPVCGVELHGTRYCPDCGQALDWGDDK